RRASRTWRVAVARRARRPGPDPARDRLRDPAPRRHGRDPQPVAPPPEGAPPRAAPRARAGARGLPGAGPARGGTQRLLDPPGAAARAAPPGRHGDLVTTTLAARPLTAAVRGYQRVTAGRPSPCRFTPSCSTYALESLETHGALKG